jgi:ATP-dependent Clp protease protease subunit
MHHHTLAAEDKAAKKDAPEKMEEQLLFKSRYVMIFGEIDDKMAQATCRRLLALSQESDAPITLLISSPGGHVESGDAIHDMIRFVRAPVTVIGTGWVASAGTHIYLAVPKERRFALPNTRFMIHQPAGGAGGQASDIAIQAREIIRTRERRRHRPRDRPAAGPRGRGHRARLLDGHRGGHRLRPRLARHRAPVRTRLMTPPPRSRRSAPRGRPGGR